MNRNHAARRFMMIRTKSLSLFGLLVLVGLLAGCSGGSSYDETVAEVEETAAVDEAVEEAVELVEVNDEILAALARADAVDGTEDMVVAKCPGCALAMEGSADHAMHVDEYELHFCSDDCKDRFAETASESILALAMPEL